MELIRARLQPKEPEETMYTRYLDETSKWLRIFDLLDEDGIPRR